MTLASTTPAASNHEPTKKRMFSQRILTSGTLFLIVLSCVSAKIIQYYAFELNDFDTGIYSNVAWNVINGHGFYSAVLGRNHLGVHFSPLTALFAPIYAIFPTAMVLMIAQGLAVGLTLILLFRLGQLILVPEKPKDHCYILLSFCLIAFFYRPLSSALLFQFHPPTVAMPILAGCLIALIERRYWLLAILVAALFTAKENAALAVAGLGIYAGLVLHQWRLALGFCLLAAAGLAAVLLVIMPVFQDGSWPMSGRFGPFALLDDKAVYLLKLLAPLGLLPLFAWRPLLAACPLIAVNLAVNYAGQLSFKFHYNDLISVFLLVAAMHGLNWLREFGRSWQQSRPDANLALPKPIHVMVMVMFCALAFNKGQNPITDMYENWPTADDWRLHAELAPYRREPVTQGIVAQSGLGPYLSHRDRYVMLKTGWSETDLQSGDLILLSSIADDFKLDLDNTRAQLDRMRSTELLHDSDVLTVFRVRGNHEHDPK